MRDPEDLRLYAFSGRAGELIRGSFLRIELLALVRRGAADIESPVVDVDGGSPVRICESEAIVGPEACALLDEIREAVGPARDRYLAKQIRFSEYLAARNAALSSRGTSAAGLCQQRLETLLPPQARVAIDVDRRVEIMAEVLRDEIEEHARRARTRRSHETARAEHAFRRAAVRGDMRERTFIPARANVAAILCAFGLLSDVGSVMATPFDDMGPSSKQVEVAIVVGVISALIRGPFVAAVLFRSPSWRSRANFTVSGLAIVLVLAAVSVAAQAHMVVAPWVLSTFYIMVGVSLGVRLAWLLFWAYYLGLFRGATKHQDVAEP